jgi:hypothetical protein
MERLTTFPGGLLSFLDDLSHGCPAVHQSSGVVIAAGVINTHAASILRFGHTKTSQKQGHTSKQNDDLLSQAFHLLSLSASDSASLNQ